MKVKLAYFRKRGKFYSEGEYETKKTHLFDIFKEVQEMLDEGRLPWLTEGSKFYVVIDVPEHENNHPHLCAPKGWDKEIYQ